MKRIFSILFALVLVLSFSLIPATPAAANGAPTVTLDMPENVYRPVTFDATSTTTNPTGGTSYTHVRFNITVSGPEPFTGAREDIFTITQVVPGGVQGINETFMLVDGDFVGYWGPASGFPLPAGYGPITSTFTIQMNDGGTAPVGNYQVTVELVDLSPDPDITLASATDGFSLSANTLYVGTGQQFTTIQAAVDATTTDAGDTIIVAAGTYHETVNVNKSVVLQSATLHGAILDPDDGAGNNDGFVVTAGSVTIEGFTIIDADDPILVWFTSDMTNIVIKHNEIDNSLGLPSGGTSGIAFASATVAPHSAAGAVVKGNIISNTHQRNAITFDGLTGDFTIHGNSISNSGFGIAVSGLDNSGTPTFKRVNVAGTVIQKNIVQNVTKAWAAGILLAGLDGGVQVIRNTLSVAGTGNDGLGLQVGSNFYKWFPGGGPDGANSYCTDVGAHANNFVGNTFAGVFNKYNPPGTSDEINARSNWWGDPSGPSGVGPGSGDAVYTNVLYKPWRKKALP